MSKRPRLYAYSVRYCTNLDGGEGLHWSKIGAVYERDDGKGLDLKLDCMPLDGCIRLREPGEVVAQAKGAAAIDIIPA